MRFAEECRGVLVEAIVQRAAQDYFDLLVGFVRPTRDCNLTEVTEFFYSDYFASLTRVNPDYILEQLRKEASKMALTYTVSKEKGSSHYYVCEVGAEKIPLTRSYTTKKKALHKAAEMQGLELKQYMQLRRKEGESE